MIVSRDWLKQYVDLDMPLDELTDRLTMAGLNLEGVSKSETDVAIDLEVTSNRPDCLGHIGVAREVAVLYDRELKFPAAQPQTIPERTEAATSVQIDCEDLCPQYIARVIRGVKVGPSPDWLVKRLETAGLGTINNIVDITNYVLLECGQPLHAFDFARLREQRIVVRGAREGEKLVAIDHAEYSLSPEMCIIADAEHAVAIAGVMGGCQTEISETTTDVLIESAQFAPIAIRSTARRLNLHSDSSFRFERSPDPCAVDWASRRCCELILDIAGGELLDDPVVAGTPSEQPRSPITLRFDQLKRILGIDIPPEQATRILLKLGLRQQGEASEAAAGFVPPSWRRDLTREVDLIEEVARIHGYDKIPENVDVPLQLSEKTHHQRIVERVTASLTAAGFFEAITLTFVSDDLFELFAPRGELRKVCVDHSSRRHENILRQSLVPSLMRSRRENERHGSFDVSLFEIADVYLDADPGNAKAEPTMVSLVSGQSFGQVKGIVEAIVESVSHDAAVTLRPSDVPQFVTGRGAEVLLDGKPWGWLGEIARDVSDKLDLRDSVVIAELDFSVLEAAANLTPVYCEIPKFPSVARDLNFVLEETVTWQELEDVVREAAGPLLDSMSFGGQYRGKQIAADKKSYLITINYRSSDRTLTNEEVDQLQQSAIGACQEKLGATLRSAS